ncbi:venom dipeptidyl peptidase 4-like [Zootermopsis nevadensis]|uniref:venom dipeptidyl peptidase 4-like n=1 Tax=Zootermopsis nevadensis TaxID=136037 RepID=UPI000B8E558A|nr:venom dipeptidyl peptidase 4-like [Zootermopsis nevadensis]
MNVQELVSKGRHHNWRNVAAFIAVGIIVLVLIIIGVVLLVGGSAKEKQAEAIMSAGSLYGEPSLSLDDIIKGRFAPNGFNGTWISGTEFFYTNDQGDAVLFDVATRRSKIIVTTRFLITTNKIPDAPFNFEFSADRRYLLIAHNYRKIFRHSFLASYQILDLETRNSIPLENSDHGPESTVHQLVVWAPEGNGFVYVHRNNIYYRPTAASIDEVQLTRSGIPAFPEEVLSSNKALWFSPDSKKLAYATFDDNRTRVMSIPFYGLPGSLEYQYTHAVNIRYPKPGTPNPTAGLSVVDLEEAINGNPNSVELQPPQELLQSEPILSAVTWATEDNVAAVWMNRIQNIAKIVSCSARTSLCLELLSLRESSGWVDLFTAPLFSSDGTRMVLILPHDQGPSNGAYRHVSIVQKGRNVALTSGKFTVTEIVSWDRARNLIYYLATEEVDPAVLHLYSVSDNPETAPNKPLCISCAVRTVTDNTQCLYVKSTFSLDSSYYTLTCSGPSVPEVSIFNKDHIKLMVLESNDDLRQLLQGKALPIAKQLEVSVPGGFKARVQLWLPPNIDMSGKTKYPLLVNVYGGPDSYQVTKQFTVDWSTYLTVNKSIIYAAIDGRGSGLKGNNMLFAVYKHLGSSEIDDQVNVTRFLQENINYIDKERTAIWGWSYGGYATGMALAKDKLNVFKCGISVAPVSDWSYYDTVYTERYMGLPSTHDNLKGYINAALTRISSNIRNKQYLLVHGTLDDNVHYQQSMMLAKALEHNDVLFQQMSYPDEEHGLTGVRPHLYHTLGNFLDRCFDLQEQKV